MVWVYQCYIYVFTEPPFLQPLQSLFEQSRSIGLHEGIPKSVQCLCAIIAIHQGMDQSSVAQTLPAAKSEKRGGGKEGGTGDSEQDVATSANILTGPIRLQ